MGMTSYEEIRNQIEFLKFLSVYLPFYVLIPYQFKVVVPPFVKDLFRKSNVGIRKAMAVALRAMFTFDLSPFSNLQVGWLRLRSE